MEIILLYSIFSPICLLIGKNTTKNNFTKIIYNLLLLNIFFILPSISYKTLNSLNSDNVYMYSIKHVGNTSTVIIHKQFDIDKYCKLMLNGSCSWTRVPLVLFSPILDPLWHESIYPIYSLSTSFTKIHLA